MLNESRNTGKESKETTENIPAVKPYPDKLYAVPNVCLRIFCVGQTISYFNRRKPHRPLQSWHIAGKRWNSKRHTTHGVTNVSWSIEPTTAFQL